MAGINTDDGIRVVDASGGRHVHVERGRRALPERSHDWYGDAYLVIPMRLRQLDRTRKVQLNLADDATRILQADREFTRGCLDGSRGVLFCVEMEAQSGGNVERGVAGELQADVTAALRGVGDTLREGDALDGAG